LHLDVLPFQAISCWKTRINQQQKLNQLHKSTQPQLTGNILKICKNPWSKKDKNPRNKKVNSHIILNTDALSTDDAHSAHQ